MDLWRQSAMRNTTGHVSLPIRLCIGVVVGVTTGCAAAVFVALLEGVTSLRNHYQWLPYLLPLAGLVLGILLEKFGAPVARGMKLVIKALDAQGAQLPLRMAPVIVFGTLATHLFGGSAGREGTAVQMGAALGQAWSKVFAEKKVLRRHFLAAGVAGGFGSVFGTPIAAAIFAFEFAGVGTLHPTHIVSALTASVVGNAVGRYLGIVHAGYPRLDPTLLDFHLAYKWVLFACLIALTSRIFIEAVHVTGSAATSLFARQPLRLAVGGILLVISWRLCGTSTYLGLGTAGISQALTDPSQPVFAFAYKIYFTALTLGFGFLGGEVTPLFFIGASLGNVVARLLQIPLSLGAGVGLVALFSSAARTPVAMLVMGVELFGPQMLPHVAVVCPIAYILSSRRGIYQGKDHC